MKIFDQQMSVLDAIQGRRSVRSYAGGKIASATLHSLLAAAVRAPTAIHQETWSFVVLQDLEMLKRLSDRAKVLFLDEVQRVHLDRGGRTFEAFSDPGFDAFYGAGTLVVICGPTSGPFIAADCWLAAENLMLAAHAMDLGTCVIGSAVTALNTAEFKTELKIPSDVSAIAPVIVGTPSGETSITVRKEPRILSWT